MRIVVRVIAGVVVLLAGLTAFDYLAPYTAARWGLALERNRSGLHEGKASIPGFEMPYLEGGSGEPLLLVHGFGADKNNFMRVARHLTPHFRVIAPDLPGFGAATRSDTATYTIAEQVERLRLFAAALGLKRVHLGGSSMGGHIATTWAGRYPDEVASLWLLAPGGTAAAFDSELRREFVRTGEILLVAKTPEEHARVRAFVMSRQPWLPHSLQRVLGERAAKDFPLHSEIFTALRKEQPVENVFSRIDVPALIVWGTEDRALNPKGADTLKAMMPQAQVILMPGVGHLPMIEAVRQSAEDYLAFRHNLAGS
jgi:pimeloyl-ACP methyl ester carboxylesterase